MRRALALATLLLAACPAPRAPARPEPLPADAIAHYLAGRLAAARGDHAGAIAELRAAAVAAPDEVEIAVAMIDAIDLSGDHEAAAHEVTAAESRWPDSTDVWLVAGRIEHALGKEDVSREAFQRAIHLEPTREAAWLGVGTADEAMGDLRAAESAYRDLLDRVPDSIDGHFLYASRLLDRGADAEAEPHLRKVLELDPDHIDARLALARSLRRAGKLDEAVTETRQAFDRTGGDLDVAEELFWLLCEADDRRGALDLLALLDDPSQTIATRVGISNLYRQIGARDQAVATADAAHAADPESTAATLAAAQARADRAGPGDRDAALKLLSAISSDDGVTVAAQALTVEILIATGKLDDALAAATALRAREPDSADALAAYGDVMIARQRPDDGLRAFVDEIDKHPGAVPVWLARASYYDRIGKPERAASDAEAVLTRHPDDITALNLAGFTLAKAGAHLDRAETYLTRARELAPGDPAILDSWGWLRFRQGKLDDAERALRHAVDLAPQSDEIRAHLDRVRAARGQK